MEDYEEVNYVEMIPGAFGESLTRNNKKIRSDRAVAIVEEAELIYSRQIEDMKMKIKRMNRERESMLDLSPTDANSLILATDFNAEQFVAKDIKLGIDIRNLEISLNVAEKRYNKLFTEPETTTK